jgi:leucyl aminopeptidase (aminopeptidase T)
MDIDDETSDSSVETGSDELLSDDNLRLPESASILVRIHAVRAWLARRYEETAIEVGEAALVLQEMMMQEPQETRLRRRERQSQQEQLSHIQQVLLEAQQRLSAYEEAQSLLEDCIAHTSGERVLVEYYLALEDLVQAATQANQPGQAPRLRALADVQHRVEHVGAPNEED